MARFRRAVAVPLLVSLVLLCASGTRAAKPKKYSPEDLINIFLSPEYSRWLVGPTARIASEGEIEQFLELMEDDAAGEFIERFWEERARGTEWPAPPPRAIFERRARQADIVYSESASLGRRTDRGMILVLYGSPAQSGFEISPRRGESPIEVWVYPRDAPKGLDGQTPERYYRFQKRGDLTEFYVPKLR
ncbi:MAG: GWxTD domain-containing protein [Thermoanaerobaculia bacterium]